MGNLSAAKIIMKSGNRIGTFCDAMFRYKGEGEIPIGWAVFYNSVFVAGQEKGGKRGSYF